MKPTVGFTCEQPGVMVVLILGKVAVIADWERQNIGNAVNRH